MLYTTSIYTFYLCISFKKLSEILTILSFGWGWERERKRKGERERESYKERKKRTLIFATLHVLYGDASLNLLL
jgi:hypothetical protein